MDTVSKLIEQFRQFPGIGPRQSKRFVYFLLSQPESYRSSIARNISELGRYIRTCTSCQRFFSINDKSLAKECSICSDPNRNEDTLLIVSRDVDFENIEKTGNYKGKYFILGGSIPILEKNPGSCIRLEELKTLVEKRAAAKDSVDGEEKRPGRLGEIILALNLTPEGENTEEYLRGTLGQLLEKRSIKMSTLGRGLSTGLELEYSDGETIKNALRNRA